MNNVTINGYGSFIQEKDLHDLMRALAKNQTLTENMMLSAPVSMSWGSLTRKAIRSSRSSI